MASWPIIRFLRSAFRGTHGWDIQYIHEEQGTLSKVGETNAEVDDPVLADCDAVTPIHVERVLVHEPSDEAFDSILHPAVFHRT